MNNMMTDREAAQGAGQTVEQSDLLASLIGPKNTDYYLRVFKKMSASGDWFSWNWPAFFFTWGWLAYRKMWGWFFAYWLLFPIVAVVVAVLLGLINPMLTGVGYLVMFFLVPPLFANKLYHRHLQIKLAEAERLGSDDAERIHHAARLGGTSAVGAVLVGLCALVLPTAVLVALSVPAYQDYTIRAQVSEAVNQAAPMKLAVSEYIASEGRLPADVASMGMDASAWSGAIFDSMQVLNGEIIIRFNELAPLAIQGDTVTFKPQVVDGVTSWECSSPTIEGRYLPSICR